MKEPWRGFFDRIQVEQVNERMCVLLRTEEISLQGIYYCPHAPGDGCSCRKPATGLIEQAIRDLSFQSCESFVVGDKFCDIELGQRIGGITFLVRTGHGAEEEGAMAIVPDYIVDNVQGIVPVIAELIGNSRFLQA